MEGNDIDDAAAHVSLGRARYHACRGCVRDRSRPNAQFQVGKISRRRNIFRIDRTCRLCLGELQPAPRDVVPAHGESRSRQEPLRVIASEGAIPAIGIRKIAQKKSNRTARICLDFRQGGSLMLGRLVFVAEREDSPRFAQSVFETTQSEVHPHRHVVAGCDLWIDLDTDTCAPDCKIDLARPRGRETVKFVGMGARGTSLRDGDVVFGRRIGFGETPLRREIIDVIDGVEFAEDVFGRLLLELCKLGRRTGFGNRVDSIQRNGERDLALAEFA
jgi:predicted nucleic acid-binding Zn ribbon protein